VAVNRPGRGFGRPADFRSENGVICRHGIRRPGGGRTDWAGRNGGNPAALPRPARGGAVFPRIHWLELCLDRTLSLK